MTPQSTVAILYRRVSTDRQDGSLEVQEERGRQYCAFHGFELIEEGDEDTSGAIPIWERPGGKRVVSLIESGAARHLVVAKLDRLGRCARDFHNFMAWLDEQKVTLHILDLGGGVQTTQGAGKILLGILALVAEFERDLIRGRIKARIDHKFARREVIGTVPFGWDESTDPSGRRVLVDNPGQQTWIRQMHAWHQSGMGFDRIATMLTEHGVTTKRAGQPRYEWQDGVKVQVGSVSGRWHYTTVKTVLESRHVAALLHPEESRAA